MPEIENIQRTLGRIEGKLDGAKEDIDEIRKSIETSGLKIGALESFRDNLLGRMSIVGAIAGVLGAFISAIFTYFTRKY